MCLPGKRIFALPGASRYSGDAPALRHYRHQCVLQAGPDEAVTIFEIANKPLASTNTRRITNFIEAG